MAARNLYQVESPEQFQELLSADLERVSVLYFYADWAEPCASMTQVVSALAEQNKAALFLNIEAEALPEISESFEVDEVPYTILLRVSCAKTREGVLLAVKATQHPPVTCRAKWIKGRRETEMPPSGCSTVSAISQGHTLLGRVSGAQPKLLAEEIAKYTSPAAALRSCKLGLSEDTT